MRRVLIGDFGALVRAGLEELLGEMNVEVVSAPDQGRVLDQLVGTMPDVIVLDLDQDCTPGIATRIASDYPAVRVLACSAATPTLRVYPPFHYGECYEVPLDAGQLAAAFEP